MSEPRFQLERRRLRALSTLLFTGLAASAALVPAAHGATLNTTALRPSAATYDALASKAATAKSGEVGVIVGLKTTFDPAAAASKTQFAGVKARLAAARSEVLDAVASAPHSGVQTYDALPYVALNASPKALRALEASGAAATITPQRKFTLNLAQSTPLVESTTEVTRGWNGTGQVVAVIDTGIEANHPFVAGRIRDEACFSWQNNCPNGTTSQIGPGAASSPLFWHGTAVAGVAAGKRSGTGTFDGVAPGAQIMPINVWGPGILESQLLSALNYVIGRVQAGVPVAAVNLSLGSSEIYTSDAQCDNDPFKAPIDTLRAAGVATVVASGNHGASDTINDSNNDGATTGVSSPACISSAITVGATSKSDVVSGFGNSSSQIELWAPGQDITMPGDGGWVTNSGTSFAAPHVTGAWADYLQRYPGTSVSDVLAAFQGSGKSVTDARNAVTKPRINVAGGLSKRWGWVNASSPTTTAYSPTQQGNSTGTVNSVVRSAVGTYTVYLPKLGGTIYGNAQAFATGTTANRCVVSSVGAGSTTGELGVRCTTSAGVAADTAFIATFQVNEAASTKKNGYVTTTSGTASHTPATILQTNTSGATNTVSRVGTGRYAVTFPNFVGAGAPQVSALSSVGVFCQITTYASSTLGVQCYNASGVATDALFLATWNDTSTFIGKTGGYVYANNATSTTAYTPGAGLTWNSAGSTNTSRKLATGQYEVLIPGIASATAVPQVTAVDANVAISCRPSTWTNGNVQVRCFNAAGTAVDAKFTVTYSSKL